MLGVYLFATIDFFKQECTLPVKFLVGFGLRVGFVRRGHAVPELAPFYLGELQVGAQVGHFQVVKIGPVSGGRPTCTAVAGVPECCYCICKLIGRTVPDIAKA